MTAISSKARNAEAAGFLILSTVAYLLLFYTFPRSNFYAILCCFVVLFAAYVRIGFTHTQYSVTHIIGAALLLRLLSIAAIPALSDDYYRFLWDGYMWLKGINAYDFKPSEIYFFPQLQSQRLKQLYLHMNSPDYYSLYPPLLQGVYAMAAWFDNQWECGIVILRLINIAAEMFGFYFLVKILERLHKPRTLLSLYALNPLVIVELSGNLHGEALVVCFLTASVYCLISDKHVALIALFFLLAVLSKLTPLLLLPLLVKRMQWKRSFWFLLFVFIYLATFSLPVFNVTRAAHFIESFRLYQRVFEFNAGIYYLLRNILWQLWGYNPIQILGPVLSVLSLLVILTLTIKYDVKNNAKFLKGVMLCYMIYLLFSTTVHPWYIIMPVLFVPFVGNITPLVWSFLAILSYATYISKPFAEQSHFLIFEYAIVFFTFIASEFKVVRFLNSSTTALNE